VRCGAVRCGGTAVPKPLDAHHRDGWLDERELEVRDSPSAQCHLPKLIAKPSNLTKTVSFRRFEFSRRRCVLCTAAVGGAGCGAARRSSLLAPWHMAPAVLRRPLLATTTAALNRADDVGNAELAAGRTATRTLPGRRAGPTMSATRSSLLAGRQRERCPDGEQRRGQCACHLPSLALALVP
jgi:hypothetical protein